MNGNEFTRLSYKELQALALRYRVPGNIKKKLLVKVLQAAKGGNESEVDRLLQDLKQNRKKRVRKLKAGKLGLTSTPLHSPSYVMADDYYCPQEQATYQWVAAEEEIASREEEGRIPHYDEFKQYLFRKIQKDFGTLDTNNNPMQEPTIVDLRTVGVSSSIQPRPLDTLDTADYSRSNIIAVNNPDDFVYQTNDRVEYQTVEGLNATNEQGSILLKKMLQAPAGANLGEIASPVFGGYRMWPVEHYQSTNLLDNSDTLTAESDTQETEVNLNSNTECYGILSGVRGEYFLQDSTFVRNVEEIGQQITGVFNNEGASQYKYSHANLDAHQAYENWNITNAVNPEAHCGTSDPQSSKVFQAMYYENLRSESLSKPAQDDNASYQYHLMENVQSPYRSSQNFLHLNSCEEVQYCNTSVITSMQSESPNTYYLQNLTKYNNENTAEYYNNAPPLPSTNTERDAYSTAPSQVLANSNQCNPTAFYEYPYTSQSSSAPASEKFGQQPNTDIIFHHEDNSSAEFTREKSLTQNGVLSPFCPKWYSNSPEPVLENILNLHSSKRIDLTRLEQTSCVYCYMAPVVTHSLVPPGSVCSQKEKFVTEYRTHSFAPYWLLYDTSGEASKINILESKTGVEIIQEDMQTYPAAENDKGVRSPREESDRSINEGWPNNNTNYEAELHQDVNVCEEMNVESTECLFPVINTDSLDITVDPLMLNAP